VVEREIRDRIRELRRVRASELVPNPKNWRRHPKEQVAALRGLLAEVGYADALLARELADGRLMLIDGHLRADTTPSMEVPVLILDVNEAEADKILLTLDPLAGMAEKNSAMVEELLRTVTTESEAVGALLERVAGEEGWQAVAGRGVVQDEVPIDKAEDLQKKWWTKAGQLWQVGDARVFCGDCRHPPASLFDGNRVRLIWTDPPYGVSYADKNESLNRTDRGNRVQKQIVNDHLTSDETEALFVGALAGSVPYCEPGAAVYATVPAGPLYGRFMRALEAAGFSYKHGLVWVKNQFVIGRSDYHYRHEPILYGWLENGAHLWAGDRSHDSVFEIDKPHVSDLHPTTKPVELVAAMIANSSHPGEVVYDPFCGSGTTLVAAHQLGRTGCGIEIDSGYVAVTLERLSALGLTPRLIGDDGAGN
jgi:DNA modification methylase